MNEFWNWEIGTILQIVSIVIILPSMVFSYYSLDILRKKRREERDKRSLGIIESGIPGGWASAWKEIQKAQLSLKIMQTWIPNNQKMRSDWTRILNNNDQKVKLKVLFGDQHPVECRSAYRDDLRLKQQPQEDWIESIERINSLARDFNKNDTRILGKFYACLPMCPVYIVDRKTVFWGLYDPFDDACAGKAFRTDVDTDIGGFFINTFDRVWDKAKPVSLDSKYILPSIDDPMLEKSNHVQEIA